MMIAKHTKYPNAKRQISQSYLEIGPMTEVA